MVKLIADSFENLFVIIFLLVFVLLAMTFVVADAMGEPVWGFVIVLSASITTILSFGLAAVFLDIRKCVRRLVEIESSRRIEPTF